MANSDSTIVYIAPGKVVEVDPRGTTVLDGMLEAQDDYGQITWTTVRPTTCFGHADAALHGDVAVRRGLQTLLGRAEKPTVADTADWLHPFSPWRTFVAAHLGHL